MAGLDRRSALLPSLAPRRTTTRTGAVATYPRSLGAVAIHDGLYRSRGNARQRRGIRRPSRISARGVHPSASANRTAFATCSIFTVERLPTGPPSRLRGTVCKWSQFTAQSRGGPSSFASTTSLGMLRIVEVNGATVTSPRLEMMESRVRIRTGLRLSGRANLYHRISPRRITRHSMIHRPRPNRLPEPQTRAAGTAICGIRPCAAPPGLSRCSASRRPVTLPV